MSSVLKAKGYTRIDRENYEFSWIIENLKVLSREEGEFLTSPIFRTKCGIKFYFKLITESEMVDSDTTLKSNIYLHCKNSVNQLKCDFKTSLIGIPEKILNKNTSAILEANKDTAVAVMPDDERCVFLNGMETASVLCELQLSKGSVTSFLDLGSIINETKATVPKLNFDWLFLDESLSDVELKSASEKGIPAHRVVLAAASPVFKAMFSHDMLENKTQSVNITDVDYDVAVEMLRFIYTGSVEKEEVSFIIDLLPVADKYQLEELQNKCEEILSSNLSTNNAIDILKVADKCSMKNFKENVIEFIKMHINQSPDSNFVGDMILRMERFFLK
ncbi:hypothetical protein TKK_0008211 [Trichogramma kaykai]